MGLHGGAARCTPASGTHPGHNREQHTMARRPRASQGAGTPGARELKKENPMDGSRGEALQTSCSFGLLWHGTPEDRGGLFPGEQRASTLRDYVAAVFGIRNPKAHHAAAYAR